jgi:hypothetical protein
MHGHDGAGARRHRVGDAAWIEGEGARVDVDQDRKRPGQRDPGDGRHTRVDGSDDLVAAADPVRPEREVDGLRAGTHPDCMARADIGSEFPFESFPLAAQNEPAALEYPSDRFIDVGLDGGVLTPEIAERDGRHPRYTGKVSR